MSSCPSGQLDAISITSFMYLQSVNNEEITVGICIRNISRF